MTNSPPLKADWYDYPRYYDISFRDETRPEADFIEAACRKYCPFRARRLLEPACGSGRLIAELAARSYRMTGLDLNQPSLDFLRRRLARRGLRASVRQADMADFRLRGPVDAAYCTFDSFRHLLGEEPCAGTSNAWPTACGRAGSTFLAFICCRSMPPKSVSSAGASGRAARKVSVTLRVLSTDRRRRMETLRVSLLVRDGEKIVRLRHDFPLRMYTLAQFRRLLGAVPSFELCDVYDFWYEIDHPLVLDNEISDTVFILKKRAGKK